MRTLAVINQKGGCGKTTTSINLAAVLAKAGQRTLLVDLDPQSHCAAGLGVPEARMDLDIGDAMRSDEPVDPERLLWPVSRCLDLAPSRMNLAGLEAIGGGLLDKPDKEHRLGRVLQALAPRFDVCLIDCSPSIGLLTFNALVACDAALVPVETSFFSLQGATKQLSTVRSLSRRMNREPKVWLVPTLHDTDSSLCEDLLDELRRRFGSKVIPAVIRRDQSLKEAASFGQPVGEYDAESKGAQDYQALGDWVLAQLPSLGSGEATDLVEPLPGQAVIRTDSQTRTDTREGLTRRVIDKTSVQLDAMHDRAKALANKIAERAKTSASSHLPDFGELKPSQTLDSDNAKRLFGARHTTSGVLFVQPLALGNKVAIVGEFNNWQPSELNRNESMGVYELCVKLGPGEHRYRLDVDGHRLADPYNSEWQLDDQGHPNSVIRVLPSASPSPATISAPTTAPAGHTSSTTVTSG